MPEDASLDEFLDADASGSDADTEASEADVDDAGGTPEEDAPGETFEDDAPADTSGEETPGKTSEEDAPGETSDEGAACDAEPAMPTYASTPEGEACAACGEAVTERWRDDGGWVCADCKEW